MPDYDVKNQENMPIILKIPYCKVVINIYKYIFLLKLGAF
jgi:hypothetical protein